MKHKLPFTMVEILLALGVCVIGICSIMVLFPIGATASRDAAMETYAANAARPNAQLSENIESPITARKIGTSTYLDCSVTACIGTPRISR